MVVGFSFSIWRGVMCVKSAHTQHWQKKKHIFLKGCAFYVHFLSFSLSPSLSPFFCLVSNFSYGLQRWAFTTFSLCCAVQFLFHPKLFVTIKIPEIVEESVYARARVSCLNLDTAQKNETSNERDYFRFCCHYKALYIKLLYEEQMQICCT